MTRIAALSLDLDGTLLDNGGLQGAVERTCEVLAAAHPRLDLPSLLAANEAVWRDYFPEVDRAWTLGELSGQAVSTEAWRRTLEACGCTDDDLAALAWEAFERQATAEYRLYADAQALFAALDRRPPLALVTNGASDTQREKLRALGIASRFDAVVISGEAGVAKPDAAVFGLALDQLGVPPEDVWHVGDNLATDVAGARAAGLTAVWVNRLGATRTPGDPEPHHELRSLAELPRLLDG